MSTKLPSPIRDGLPVAGSTARSRNQHPRTLAMLLGVVLLLGTFSSPTIATDDTETLFSLPVGGLIAYAGTGDEQATWGPMGVAVDADGTIWIADGAEHRALGFSRDGDLVLEIDFDTRLVGLNAIATHADKLIVLDYADVTPKILVASTRSGDITTTIPLPSNARLENGLSGITVMADGTIAAELEGGLRLVSVARLTPGSSRVSPFVLSGSTYTTDAGTVRISEDAILVNGNRVVAPVENILGTTRIVGTTTDTFFVSVDEVTQTQEGTMLVDRVVHALDITGTLGGSARLPLSEMVAIPNQPVAATADGELIALVPRNDTIDIVLLNLRDSLPTVLPAMDPPEFTVADALPAASCVTRATMTSADQGYRNNSKYLSTTNISGACAGRTAPRYLAAAGTYSSVPYEWGGFDTVATFNGQMSPGTGKAGNINTANVLGCSFGVDCSGFVSRVWQLTTKYSTSTLPNVSRAIHINGIVRNDIFNKAGSHVVLFKSTSGGGYYISEATTSGALDRVIYRWVDSSYLTGYTLRRPNNVCCDPTVEMCPVVADPMGTSPQ